MSIAEACLAAKKAAGKTYDEIADGLGYTNCYTCQLLLGQSQLKDSAATKLKEILPTLSDDTIEAMKVCPVRSWDESILKEPNVYRTYEAVTHYGMAIKNLVNEKFGDGIMSAIDFYLTVGEAIGAKGEKRVVITLNGKFLPFIEQHAAENTA